MADVPAQRDPMDLPMPASSGSLSPAITPVPEMPGARVLAGFSSLPFLRQIGLLIALAASTTLGVSVVLWMQEGDYRPITGSWSSYDIGRVSELLGSRGIDYRVNPDSGVVMVPAQEVRNARMALAGNDMLGDNYTGTEILEKDLGFGTSQFRETKMYERGLEGELARSITAMTSVRLARVHLAIPRQTAFVRDSRRPTASVFVTFVGGREPESREVKSIVNLVAAAVPEMKPEDVKVIDQAGNFLSGMNGVNDDVADADLARKLQIEGSLREKIFGVLGAKVGHDRLRVQVTADINYAHVERTSESYDPDLPAVVSEHQLEDRRVGTQIEAGIPGALANEPPANAQVPEVADGARNEEGASTQPGRLRREITKNYESNRTIEYRRPSRGQVERLNIAVLIDDMATGITDGTAPAFRPWPESELLSMARMVRSAVGFNEARGDELTLLNSPFVDETPEEADPPALLEQPWFQGFMKQLLGALALVAIGFGVLRPAFKTIAGKAPEPESEFDGSMEASMVDDEELDKTLNDVVSLTQGSRSRIGAAAGYGPQLDAVRGLVAEDPARVAAVVKAWVRAED